MLAPTKLIASVLMFSLFAGSLNGPVRTVARSYEGSLANQDDDSGKERTGLRFHLSPGIEQPDGRPSPNLAPVIELSQSETETILNRLPSAKVEANVESGFNLRERSLPPPRTGQTINISFPSPTTATAPDPTVAGPLEIVRFAPEGDVPLAPQLSVTFSQPMIALSSQEEAAANLPVKLSPQPPGKWRWVGTKTLLFEPAGRFPMATRYTVSVRAGTRSANGGVLAVSKMWTFTTPPPNVKATYPAKENPQPRDALMFVEFDQRIDPAAVLRTIKVQAGNRVLKTRLATGEEVKKRIDEDFIGNGPLRQAVKDRWLAFRAVDSVTGQSDAALPLDSQIRVSIAAGTRSAEGPNGTIKAQEFSFQTHGPLRVTKHDCDGEPRCQPGDGLSIEFSNPLDESDFDDSKIKIEPKLDVFETFVSDNSVVIRGRKRGRTTYRVTLDGSIRDQFNQTLGRSTTVSFEVGPAPRAFHGLNDSFIVLDPAGPPQSSVYSINYTQLKVRLYAVVPEDWPKWVSYREEPSANSKKGIQPPGRLVVSKTIPVRANPDGLVETAIDLSAAMTNGYGQMILTVEPQGGTRTSEDDEDPDTDAAWIQRTDIGLDAFVDHTDLIGWVTSLKDGRALGGVDLTLVPYDLTATSDPEGLARLALKSQSSGATLDLLVARRGSDVAILPKQIYQNDRGRNWTRKDQDDSLVWYVFDDRKIYRPGEEVHIKGWLRRIGGGKYGDVGPLAGAATDVAYVLKDSRGNQIKLGTLPLNAFGGFNTSFKLPDTMNLGNASLKFQALNGIAESYIHEFQVAEFRRPEFEVNVKSDSQAPFYVGGNADLSVTANYYAGGGLPNTAVKWRVTSRPGEFTPPNRDDYNFGEWTPWWDESDEEDIINAEEFTATTDATGKHRLHIDFDSVNPPRASTVTAEASVTDTNRQTWTSTTTMLVHPADLYVGLKSEKMFVQQGDPLVVESIVTDLDGQLIPGRQIKMRAVRLEWRQRKGEWSKVESTPQECLLQSAADAVKCTFQTEAGGQYRIAATIRDDRERRNESELTLWVAGEKQPPKLDVEEEDVELIPDRKEYKPGETAEVLVQAPFYPAEGLFTLQRSGSERFHMDGPAFTLHVAIEEGWTPNVHVQVNLVGAADREDASATGGTRGAAKRTAFASGNLNLSISPLDRRLEITATPRDKALEPGGETSVAVEVRDAGGKAVSGSEVAVVVVDEAVLSLTNYKLDDPVSVFYKERSGDVSDYHLRESVLLSIPITEMEEGGGGEGRTLLGSPMRMRMMAGLVYPPPPPPNMAPMIDLPGGPDPIRIRQNFNALAVFSPSVRTNSDGRAQVNVTLPDNLTRYRVMAVAVAGGKQFGSGESAITARMPMMVRPSAPRFLNFGDRFEFPIVIQNQTDDPLTVDLAVRETNVVVTAPTATANGTAPLQMGRRVTVTANDRVEVRIPASAAKPGTARFQIAAVAGRWSDAAEVSLPIWTPATTEAFATYGEIDQGSVVQQVKAPANVFKQFGGLEIETSSTQLQQLTDAFLYLQTYPYECSEQLASRIISVAALRDVLSSFKAQELPPANEIEAAVVRDLKRLEGMQNADGGFGFWKRGEESWPFLSIHVAHALARARQKKFVIPPEMFEKSRKYLQEIESHIPKGYGLDTRRALIAYSLYVRSQMGDRDRSRAHSLIAQGGLENLSLESVGWLLSVLSGDSTSQTELAAIRHLLANRVTETAATAHFASSYKDGDYLLLNSDRRADGVILEALIRDQPANDLIPKIVRGLLAQRTSGRWNNTQENVFILLALDKYFNTYEKVMPDFIARVWLGDAYAGEQQFKGRSVDRQQVSVPMRYLTEKAGENNVSQNLIVSKEGGGRLYYRLGLNYAPLDLNLKSADDGFTVERTYEAVDHPEDVRRNAEGTWQIKAGARVRVRLTMAASSRRYHVALVDHLPAGFETLNPELAVTESIPEDKQQEAVVSYGSRSYGFGWWLWRPVWFDHQNLRDDRAEAFTSLLWEGVYNYSYVARATTPGLFVVPPSKAEEMYHPENFGRGHTDHVRIE